MDQWNKGGLSREEFLRMRESAIRQLRELAQKQQAERGAKTAPQQIGYAPKKGDAVLPDPPAPAAKEEKDPDPNREDPTGEQENISPRQQASSLEDEERPGFGHSAAQPQNGDFAAAIPADVRQKPQDASETDSAAPVSGNLFQTFFDISRITENIGSAAASGSLAESDDRAEGPMHTAEENLTPARLETSAPEKKADEKMQNEEVLPAFSQDDLFLLPEQAPKIEDENDQPYRQAKPLSQKRPGVSFADEASSSWQPEAPKPGMPPLYHPDAAVLPRTGKGGAFHPDAVRPVKEGRYIPPEPFQKPPYRRRSFWKAGDPKKK